MRPELEAVLVANHRKFLSFLERRLGQREAAEDLLQSAVASALEKRSPAEDAEGLVRWFYAVLRNALADHFRRGRVQARALRIEAEQAVGSVDPELMAAVCACMHDLLPTLKPEYAEMVRRADLEERPLSEIARTAGITPNNATVRLHRARQALKRQLLKSCGTCAAHGCLECGCGRAQVLRAR